MLSSVNDCVTLISFVSVVYFQHLSLHIHAQFSPATLIVHVTGLLSTGLLSLFICTGRNKIIELALAALP